MSRKATIIRLFPKLSRAHFRITSPRSRSYNCLAWAAGRVDRWWDPAPGYPWPAGIPRLGTVQAIVQLYESQGFAACGSREPERGFEKVALYAIGQDYTHASRQLPNGKWTSKLGKIQDIQHDDLEVLEGATYGSVTQLLKRPIALSAPPPPSPPARRSPPARPPGLPRGRSKLRR